MDSANHIHSKTGERKNNIRKFKAAVVFASVVFHGIVK